MNSSKALVQIVVGTILAGILVALALTPIAGIGGVAVARTNQAMTSDLSNMSAGVTPGITTIRDRNGEPMAYLFRQNRTTVPSDQIAQSMKDAIVSIEDRRFYSHEGVDLQGTLRALATNLVAGGVEQGASTLNQQYVKNYLLHVDAKTDEEQAAATEQSAIRKLREMRMATELDKTLTKDEILARYLNLVPFGNHAYGIEAAAQTYFGIPAAQLSVGQSAMLAGMVQSSEYLNPFTNYDDVLARRNVVLQAMVDFGALAQADATRISREPLGVLDKPRLRANGCISAGDRGFFCDYVVRYLQSKGLTEDDIFNGSLDITTTLDPAVQDAARNAATGAVSPQQPGVAEVIDVVAPGEDRAILAMASSRDYGLDSEAFQTTLPQTSSTVGNGAGSIFKVFTAAVALQQGYGLQDLLDVPARYEIEGMGEGGAADCPPGFYCVENAGEYAPQLTLQDALAHSPNTPFVMLAQQTGVAPIADMAVKLGLRSYAKEGSYDGTLSVQQFFSEANLGSFTLGPTAVNPLELSNVGATLGDSGRWCEPTPIISVKNHAGQEVALDRPACEQVIEPELANDLAQAMTADVDHGTAHEAASQTGFTGRAASKTGTTESNQSSAFLGFNSSFAAAPYIFNDGTSTTPLCTSPVRQCDWGNLFGGKEPATSYFNLHMASPEAMSGTIPAGGGAYTTGTTALLLGQLKGLPEDQARARLADAGIEVSEVRVVPGNGLPRGTVVKAYLGGGPSKVILETSDGAPAVALPTPTPETGAPEHPDASPTTTGAPLEDIANGVTDLLEDLGIGGDRG